MRNLRPISWLKPALKEFQKFPEGAQERILQALNHAAEGRKSTLAKPLSGFGAGIFEVALEYRNDAYRAVYALQIDEDLWVVHAFQKKSKKGIKTPQEELDLIRERLKRLKEHLK